MLSKIANAAEGQTLSWQQQKAEMEEHYSQLLAEIHARHKVLIKNKPKGLFKKCKMKKIRLIILYSYGASCLRW